ncbi:MAG: ATP synthase F1 subunit epsilon [Planctomycetota bacterium]|nr:ATP synthase F1 subunit epsilon [Planctomycetota bacterium]
MASATNRTFHCVVIAPAGRLLDCKAASVVFPAHDGQVGILYNHMPMFCELGLGIMEVKTRPGENRQEDKIRLLIDGGFALISSNLLTIIASDAICGRELEREKIEQMLEKSRKKLASGTFTPEQRQYEVKKNGLLASL